jgi:hypothetical protein
MRNKFVWIITIILGIGLLLAAWTFLRGWQFGGMMGGYGMMGRGYYPMMSFGWFGMALMWLLPIALIVLVVMGAASLIGSLAGKTQAVAVAAAANGSPCPNCGEVAQAGWKHCPYCGQGLA